MNRIVPTLPLVLALLAALPNAHAAEATDLKAKYEGKSFVLQHNLHVDDNEAEWQNFIAGDFVPIGSKVTVTKIDKSKAMFAFTDPTRTVKLDLAGANPDATYVLDHMLGATAPSMKGLNKDDEKGIKRAFIVEGMSRKGVFLAVGYPPYSYTPPFRKDTAVNHEPKTDDELTYMKGTYDFFKIHFGSAGTVAAIED